MSTSSGGGQRITKDYKENLAKRGFVWVPPLNISKRDELIVQSDLTAWIVRCLAACSALLVQRTTLVLPSVVDTPSFPHSSTYSPSRPLRFCAHPQNPLRLNPPSFITAHPATSFLRRRSLCPRRSLQVSLHDSTTRNDNHLPLTHYDPHLYQCTPSST